MVAALSGIFILIVAISGGVFFARRNAEQQRQVKVLLFVLYFWGLVFVQLIVFALGYYWFIKT